MASIWSSIEREVLPTPGIWKDHPEQLRHQDSRIVYDLCAHPEITGRLASLIGPDLVIWLTTENACVQFIPGSQNRIVPHVKAGPEMHFAEMADPTSFDASAAVNMILKPGEFFIFNERVLHHSEPNRSNKRRLSMVIRYTLPFVKVPPLIPEHRMILAGGQDRFGINQLGEPPRA
jgi:ectoine hydroxylase-related dioxygenase (phytanoyl-CoA dioxygenase family)